MADFASELLPVDIEQEMKQSYLDYAMSVIVGRALPDVRDGLKPVHRRVLYAMSELGLDWNRAYKKSARVVGDTTGKYHPHGDTAVYEALVRMAQWFSMREPLVDGQGNFGSTDGDKAAAMRYTEVRLTRIAHAMLADLDKDTVDFIPNYDESESEPSVFPTRVPNLLVNGSAGIAVGMATSIPPHNLNEVINGCLAFIEDADISIEGLMQHITGPDFPTGGIINGVGGIRSAYLNGQGSVQIRSKHHFETRSGKLVASRGLSSLAEDDDEEGAGAPLDAERIVFTELPYQVNKARLQTHMAELVRAKKLDGLRELRDESDKDGTRLVIELKQGANAEVVLNNLLRQTQLQNNFAINLVALIDGRPRRLNLKQFIEAFVRHRREVVTRRTLFELGKARDRAHILEGLAVALASIDPIIAAIKASANRNDAREALLARTWPPGVVAGMLERAGADSSRPEGLEPHLGLVDGEYQLSEVQANAILDLQLSRLTALEQDKIVGEYDEILGKIAELLRILEEPGRLDEVIREELEALREGHASGATAERLTEIDTRYASMDDADLIAPADVVVTLSREGYVKYQKLEAFQAQARGGKGKTAATTRSEDVVESLFVAHTHDTVLCFSSAGKVYWKRVFQFPEASRTARGTPIVNLLPLDKENDERIRFMLSVDDFNRSAYVLMATANGVVKKTPLSEYSRPRTNGIIAINLDDDDQLMGGALTTGEQQILLASSSGMAIRFDEREARAMGRNSRGVRGIRLAKGERVIDMIVSDADGGAAGPDGTGNATNLVLAVTENGYGKCTDIDEYRPQGRGGKGLVSIKTSERNGAVVGTLLVGTEDEIMMLARSGKLVRTRVKEVRILGRNTQGVKLMSLGDGEKIVAVDRVLEADADALPAPEPAPGTTNGATPPAGIESDGMPDDMDVNDDGDAADGDSADD